MNITLSPEIEKLVKKKVDGGEYESADAFFDYAARQALLEGKDSAEASGTAPSYEDVEDLLVDQQSLDYYSRDADASVTLDEVRQILSAIPSSLADAIIAERG